MLNSVRRSASTAGTQIGRSLAARAGLIQISIAAGLWGLTGVVVSWIHDGTALGPVTIGFYRLAFASLALLVVSSLRLPTLVRAVRAQPVTMIAAGVGLALYQALYFISVTTAGVTVATVVSLGVAPMVLVVWEGVVRRRRPSVWSVSTVVVSVAGLVLVARANTATAATPAPALGLLAAVCSGTCYAASTVISTQAARNTDLLTFTTATTTIGALAMIPAAAVTGFGWPLTAVTAGQLAFLGVVTTAMAYGLFYAGLRSTPSSVAAVLTLIEPLTAALLAAILLAEPLSVSTEVGGSLLLAAVATLYLSPQQESWEHDHASRTAGTQEAMSSPR